MLGDMDQFLNQPAPCRVLVLGGASWNLMVRMAALPGDRPATIPDCTWFEAAGSTGLGKAMALAALGYRPVLHATLGEDDAGDRIRALCDSRGITLIADKDPAGTARHLNLMDHDGRRISIFLSNGSSAPDVDMTAITTPILDAQTIFLGITASSLPLLPLLRESDAEILVDLHDYDGISPWHAPFIACADVVQVSDEQLSAPSVQANAWLSQGKRQVIVTRGADGATIHSPFSKTDVPPVSTLVKDANGAGDVFSVALWHAERMGAGPDLAGSFAAMAAAATLSTTDLVPPDLRARIRQLARALFADPALGSHTA